MHGPACIFWANLTPFSLKGHAAVLDVLRAAVVARLRAGTPVDQPPVAVAAVAAGAATVGTLWDASVAGDLAEMVRL